MNGLINSERVKEISYFIFKSTRKQDNLFASIIFLKREYDYDMKLLRKDYVLDNKNIREIHDFNTGLSYLIEKDYKKCTVLTINENDDNFNEDAFIENGKIQMRTPLGYFSFDVKDWQYVGAVKLFKTFKTK
jgi:hypothetical protein